MGSVNRFPFPEVGDVLNYNYLFKADADRGAIEGRKARPVLVVAAGDGRVAVMPITTKGEFSNNRGVRLPTESARAMGLPRPDECWLLTSEINVFNWVGFDIALVPGKTTSRFGRATPGLVASAIAHFREGRGQQTSRD